MLSCRLRHTSIFCAVQQASVSHCVIILTGKHDFHISGAPLSESGKICLQDAPLVEPHLRQNHSSKSQYTN